MMPPIFQRSLENYLRWNYVVWTILFKWCQWTIVGNTIGLGISCILVKSFGIAKGFVHYFVSYLGRSIVINPKHNLIPIHSKGYFPFSSIESPLFSEQSIRAWGWPYEVVRLPPLQLLGWNSVGGGGQITNHKFRCIYPWMWSLTFRPIKISISLLRWANDTLLLFLVPILSSPGLGVLTTLVPLFRLALLCTEVNPELHKPRQGT